MKSLTCKNSLKFKNNKIIRYPCLLLKRIYSKIFRRKANRFFYLQQNYQFSAAYMLGQELLRKPRHNPEIFHSLAICCNALGLSSEANLYAEKYIQQKVGISVDLIIQEIIRMLEANYSLISNKFVYLGGWANCGFIETELRKKNTAESEYFLTKIYLENSSQAGRLDQWPLGECFFYTEILPKAPQLSEIVPRFIDQRIFRGLHLTTFSKAIGHHPKKTDLPAVIRINQIIESVSYKNLPLNVFSNKSVLSSAPKRLIITPKSINQVKSYLLNKITTKKNSFKVKRLVIQLFEILIKTKIYDHLDEETHYSLCHSDFNKSNILLGDNYTVIDWAMVYYGPKGTDMGNYFKDFQFTFREIRQQYLDTRYMEINKTSAVSIVLFIYFLFYWWINDGCRNIDPDSKYEEYFCPAFLYAQTIAKAHFDYQNCACD